jgi:hypothetical protein
MITIKILEKTCSNEEMAYILKKIASQIEKGENNSLIPSWELIEDEEEIAAVSPVPDDYPNLSPDFTTDQLKELAKLVMEERSFLHAVKFVKQSTLLTLKESKEFCNKL